MMLFWCCSYFSQVGLGPVSCVCSCSPDTGCEWGPKQALPRRRWGIAFNPLFRSQERAVSRSSTHNIKPKAGLCGYLAVLWSSAWSQKAVTQCSHPTSNRSQLEKPWCSCKHPSLLLIHFFFSTSVLTSTFKAGRLSVWKACNLRWFSHPVLYSFTFYLHIQCIQNCYLRPQSRGTRESHHKCRQPDRPAPKWDLIPPLYSGSESHGSERHRSLHKIHKHRIFLRMWIFFL